MDHDQRHDHGRVLVASPRRRVRCGIRALLEAAGFPVLDTAAPDAAGRRDIAVVVLDLTEQRAIPPALMRPGAPPVVGLVKGPNRGARSAYPASAVQIDDGPDAIIDAVRAAMSRPPR